MYFQSWDESFQSQWNEIEVSNDIQSNPKFDDYYKSIFSTSKAILDAQLVIKTFLNPSIPIFTIENIEGENFFIQIFNMNRVSLTKLMPIFDSLGIEVMRESEFKIEVGTENCILQVFEAISPFVNENSKKRIIEAMSHILCGKVETNSLNELILTGDLSVHDINFLHALVRSLKQFGLSTSISHVIRIMRLYPNLINKMMFYVDALFNPVYSRSERHVHIQKSKESLLRALNFIKNSYHDRVLKNLYDLVNAIVRTNLYLYRDYISIKFSTIKIPKIIHPIPLYEIFVYAPFMEGVHLRGGKISRGGIRWSERLEDYRLEILDLYKTQTVKNAIIIPVGAKGGFVCRHYDELQQKGAAQNVLSAEVIRSYTTFIRGLLDITDNQINGAIKHPENIICYDKEDPYLVIAADKGTSNFSDTANAIAKDYNFWLDDAFASGGSSGYDHKKIGITSKGAWISVTHHLKACGKNPDIDTITVVGVGDMSGDIFGNGMLMSQNIKLFGAFDHHHIFIDPNPDATSSFIERKRLFELSKSSWNDYKEALISEGGGVFSRDAKEIMLTKQIKERFKIDSAETKIIPDELIKYILKAECDLLWFGGIGTYVKSSFEHNPNVHDTGNDQVRIDATELNALVIGEGANLPLTQQARIEFSNRGGLINTDAFDNSAGVSCSDHEVNIKILFKKLMDLGRISRDERNQMLESIKDDVIVLVLKDNKIQNEVLDFLEKDSKNNLDQYITLITFLQSNPFHAVEAENLPSVAVLASYMNQKRGLTRPELAMILAYSKINFYKMLSETKQDNLKILFQNQLLSYFSKSLQNFCRDEILDHPLSNEIIETIISNEIINTIGPVKAFELIGKNNGDVWKVVNIYYNSNI
jgi:glutamate dehydrogenase